MKYTMNLHEAITILENIRSDPIPSIDFLILKRYKVSAIMRRHLDCLLAKNKFPILIYRFRLLWSVKARADRVIMRRLALALGAFQSYEAVPLLLNLLSQISLDRKLGIAASWSLANIGELAIMPLFSFARNRDQSVPARCLAIITLGHIRDLRVPTIFHQLWHEFNLEDIPITVAILNGLSICHQEQEARLLTVQTKKLWRTRESVTKYKDDYWINLEFKSAAESLDSTLQYSYSSGALQAWQRVFNTLGSE